MGDLVDGDDGFPAEKVGAWASEKHDILCRFVDISRGARAKFLGAGKAGATYIDLFCGPGRSQVQGRGFIDGSCVAAWRKSVEGGKPFSRVIIADLDQERLNAAEERLRRLGAPVEAFCGPAVLTSKKILPRLNESALHFAFLDPFSLGALDFNIFSALFQRKRMDILVHLSKMDLQRNLGGNIAADASAFDAFAPGWRKAVEFDQAQRGIRSELIDFWKSLISERGFSASENVKLITGGKGQHLYWLMLVASHDLAHRFWKTVSNTEKQGQLWDP